MVEGVGSARGLLYDIVWLCCFGFYVIIVLACRLS